MKTKIEELRNDIYVKDLDVWNIPDVKTLLDIIEKQHEQLSKIQESYHDITEDADTGICYEMFSGDIIHDIALLKKETTEMLNNIEL